jgi:hypothetical protein
MIIVIVHFLFYRLLHTQAAFCHFDGAEITYRLALEVMDRLRAANGETNLAGLFAEFSVLHFSRSEYDEVCHVNAHLSILGVFKNSIMKCFMMSPVLFGFLTGLQVEYKSIKRSETRSSPSCYYRRFTSSGQVMCGETGV